MFYDLVSEWSPRFAAAKVAPWLRALDLLPALGTWSMMAVFLGGIERAEGQIMLAEPSCLLLVR